MQDNKDIDLLVSKIRNVKANVKDNKLTEGFITENADKIVTLLHELKRKRGVVSNEQLSLIRKNSHRIIVEGYSEKDINDAFSNALEKVIPYFSEHHDVNVTVLGLIDLPKGGYRATLEVHLTPIKMLLTEKREDPDSELKRLYDDNNPRFKSREEKLQHLVHHHFLDTCGTLSSIPEHFLINICDADILNMMIEKDFFHVSTNNPVNEPKPPVPSNAVIRVLKPDSQTSSEK